GGGPEWGRQSRRWRSYCASPLPERIIGGMAIAVLPGWVIGQRVAGDRIERAAHRNDAADWLRVFGVVSVTPRRPMAPERVRGRMPRRAPRIGRRGEPRRHALRSFRYRVYGRRQRPDR